MEPSSPKKIQFAVPPLQGQLDPQAAEHVSVCPSVFVCVCVSVIAEQSDVDAAGPRTPDFECSFYLVL